MRIAQCQFYDAALGDHAVATRSCAMMVSTLLQRIGNLQAARWCKTATVSFESITVRIKVRVWNCRASNFQPVLLLAAAQPQCPALLLAAAHDYVRYLIIAQCFLAATFGALWAAHSSCASRGAEHSAPRRASCSLLHIDAQSAGRAGAKE